jgi:hypothetical protein
MQQVFWCSTTTGQPWYSAPDSHLPEAISVAVRLGDDQVQAKASMRSALGAVGAHAWSRRATPGFTTGVDP